MVCNAFEIKPLRKKERKIPFVEFFYEKCIQFCNSLHVCLNTGIVHGITQKLQVSSGS